MLKKFLAITCLLFITSACVPVGEEKVNTDLFKTKEDLKAAASALEIGMKKDDVFEKLGIPIEKFSFMSTPEIQITVYGNSQVQGSPEELEKFKKQLLTYEGYYLPYKDVGSKGSLGFAKMNIDSKGHSLRLILVFEKNHLLKATVEGDYDVNLHEDKYIWGTILKKSTGFGF